ncbi:MAG: hypothetical protein U5L05_05285 [Rubrivivax sp.]|nr:hypothetical protein [Rubrivivax sp.]
MRIDNDVFIICASVQVGRFSSRRCNPINPTRTTMFLFMPSVERLACRPAAGAAAAGVTVNAGFAEAAPPGAGVR